MLLNVVIALCTGALSWALFGHFWGGVIGASAWMLLFWALRQKKGGNS